ncbi:MAG: bifunctional folylpolyglutamate synthase/dihydrofolate synthase [Actinomycetota bacterium]|nr:bifunctional folylpolyglutamate synthase/dihydrofolate synthase [Actinomycetota bacterium]
MRYSQAIEYLDSKALLGIKPSLERIVSASRELGNPQDSFDSIHITGTNGKTTVAHMISEILGKSGYRVGRFTSPHLETVRERISVDGRMIPVSVFARELSEIRPAIEKAEEEVMEKLSYFETLTALAFHYFAKEKIDVAVLEVGMGGRWDSTNIANSCISVITNIHLDHMNELGRTKKSIAFEKIGIIKDGSVVVTAESSRDLLFLISERCEQTGSIMKVFGRDFRLDYVVPYRVPGESPAQYITILGLGGLEFKDIKIPMIGKHQAVNAAVAVAAAQSYTDPRGKTDESSFVSSLERVQIPGRLEIVSEKPMVVIDGAHNQLGAERLVSTISTEFEYEKVVFIVSILRDKDARRILQALASLGGMLILTENRSSRRFTARKLADYCSMDGIPHKVEPDFPKAIRLAYNITGKNDLICITGSLFTVSEARVLFKRQKYSREAYQDRL